MAKDKEFEKAYKVERLKRTAKRKERRKELRIERKHTYGSGNSICPYCGNHRHWCSSCQVWSSSCCIEYGTCQCS